MHVIGRLRPETDQSVEETDNLTTDGKDSTDKKDPLKNFSFILF